MPIGVVWPVRRERETRSIATAIVDTLEAEPVEGDPPVESPRRRITAADIICGIGVAWGVIAAYVFIALTPKLLAHHSILLEALRGSTAAIVSGGALARVGRESLVLVLLAPLCTVALYDVFYWWAGRLWGNYIVDFYTQNNPRTAKWLVRSESLVRRWGIWALIVSYYLPLPTFLIFVACGMSGVPLWLFVIGVVIGKMLWVGLLVGLGWAFGHPAVHVINEINHYSTRITIGLIVVIVLFAIIRTQLRLRRGPTSQPDHSGSS